MEVSSWCYDELEKWKKNLGCGGLGAWMVKENKQKILSHSFHLLFSLMNLDIACFERL